MDLKIDISIIVLTYNHAIFFEESIQSFLNQKGEFKVEIIVGDDCSKDGTYQLFQNLNLEIPSNFTVRYKYHSSNIGLIENFKYLMNEANGEFISICASDDFWKDQWKISKQLNYLRENDKVFAVSADTVYLEGTTYRPYTYIETKESWLGRKRSDSFSFEELINRFFPHPNTLMFRNQISIPKEFNLFNVEDFPLYMLLADKGEVKYLDEVMTAYRVHPASITRSQDYNALKNQAEYTSILYVMDRYFGGKYRKEFKKAVRNDVERILMKFDKIDMYLDVLSGVENTFELKVLSIHLIFYLKLKVKLNKLSLKGKSLIRKIFFR